jgi:hypothetical protein
LRLGEEQIRQVAFEGKKSKRSSLGKGTARKSAAFMRIQMSGSAGRAPRVRITRSTDSCPSSTRSSQSPPP